jgi:DNA processing protein
MPSFTLDLFAETTTAPDWETRLALWHVLNQSVTSYQAVLQHFGSANVALRSRYDDWQRLGLHASHLKRVKSWQAGTVADHTRVEQVCNAVSEQRYQLLQPNDLHYPKALAMLDDAPPFLFVQGESAQLLQPQIAIVGTRQPTPSGRKLAQRFAATLAEQGLWITSGLAQGIDADAHIGALSVGGGRTIAVLGTGLDVCYPSSHKSLLARMLAEGGTVVSEFLPDTAPLAYHFPRRNRIVSGLSLGVLVVEAAVKSGSLITARLAAEQGRLVFAIPGHVDNPLARGCHHLIREGAILVDEPAQILEDLELPRHWQQHHQQLDANSSESADVVTTTAITATNITRPAPATGVPVHLQAVLAQLDWTGQDMDQLVMACGLDVASLSGLLMELELLGLVIQQGGRYQRCLA